MPEARLVREWNETRLQVAAAVDPGDIWQQADGRAAVHIGAAAVSTGLRANFETAGKYTINLTSGITILDGGRVYFDHSARLAHYKKVNDRDFYLGRAIGDTSSDTVVVDLNVDPPYDIDVLRDACLSVPTGTQAVGAFGFPKKLGGSLSLELTATNEAQCIDLLSVDGFATGANAIIEAIFRIANDGSNATQDFNIGVANGTSTTDADAITESIFCHVDGNSTNLALESDDGTTEVAATDSTYDYTEGSAVTNRVHVWFDMRDPADVQIYINGVLALPSTTFNVNVAVGPWFLLAHLEKSSSTDVYRVIVDALRARFMEQ